MSPYVARRTPRFVSDLARLRRKFRRIDDDLNTFLSEALARPLDIGNQIPGVHPPLSKARMKIASARISARDGCRVLYRVDDVRHVIYLARIYHKAERKDVTPGEIRAAEEEIRSLEEREMFREGLKRPSPSTPIPRKAR
jgi:hypothetical protein